MPIMMFSISAPLPAVELTSFLEQNVQKRLESVNGVGEVILFGAAAAGPGQDRSRPAQRLRAVDLGRRGGVARAEPRAAGRPSRTGRAGALGPHGRPADPPEEFADVVVATRGNIPIRIKDIGTVDDTGADPLSVSSLNGKAAISVAIRKQSGVNTVALSDAIRARMAEVEKTLPPTFEVRLIRDDSEFIRASLAAIEEHLILGGILAAIIVLVFLRNFRSTLIAAVAIPASIIGAFGVMSALNFTINQMTMLALTLMVGIVIDDAIVVLENIYRFVEEKGMTPRRAAVEATKEIGLAVMATTMSLLAVFLPVGFLGGSSAASCRRSA